MNAHRDNESSRRLGACVALLLMLVAPPVLLSWAVGLPLPNGGQISTAVDLRWVSPELASHLAASAGWALWLYLVGCLTAITVAQLRGVAIRVPAPHFLVSTLRSIVAVALVGVTMTSRVALAAPAPAAPPISAPVAVTATAHVDLTSVGHVRTCVVQPRDTLWDIAGRELGDPLRWRELWSTNAQHVMNDGTHFTDPDLIRPGWVLKLPAEHRHGTVAPVRLQPAPTSPPVMSPPPASVPSAAVVSPQPSIPIPSTSALSGQQHSHNSEVPLGLGLGAGAVGVAAALVAARRRRGRARPTGLRPALPTGDLAAVEAALRDESVTGEAEKVAGVLRLAAALSSEPFVVEKVTVDEHGVHLRLGRPTPLPSPFSQEVSGEHLLSNDELGAIVGAHDLADPAPALMSLGDGAYLNLEWARSLALSRASVEELSGLVAGLAYTPWAGTLDVTCLIDDIALIDPEKRIAGPETELDPVRARAERVVAEVQQLGASSLASLRALSSTEAPDGATVIVIAAGHPDVDDVLHMADDPRSPVVALLLGEHAAAHQTWPLADAVVVTPLSVVTPALVETTQELFAQVDHDFVPPTAEPYAAHQELPSEEASDFDIIVRVLGPLDVVGDVPHLKPQLIDIMVYLSLHDRPVSLDEMATALWPEDVRSSKSLRNRVYELRKALGGRLSTGPGWKLDDTVTTDWVQFRRLAAGEVTDRQAALRLVRGQPLHQVRGDWAGLEGFESEMTARVVDLALDVSEKLLASADPDAAMESARAGLRACPWEERLYVVAMQAAADRGAIGEVTSLYREMTGVLDLEIDAQPEPESRATYESLLREARRAAGAREGMPEAED